MIDIKRYPPSQDKSLKAWSAADELILSTVAEEKPKVGHVTIYNDRYGYLAAHAVAPSKTIVCTHKSQEEAINKNLSHNAISDGITYHSPLDQLPLSTDLALLKVPKSLDLFRLFLVQIHRASTPDTMVCCGFMTKYFTRQMLEIAAEFFDTVTQSRAWKKARVMILTHPKETAPTEITHQISFNRADEQIFLQQYYGVFSAHRIDYATQFLIEHLELDATIHRVLDLASGNGIIAHELLHMKADLEMHLMDDSVLAIASSKINLAHTDAVFHYAYALDNLPKDYFDLVVCNPPFHFEHENTIEIALSLFRGVASALHPDGRFICVANVHLNYKTHLIKIFDQVDTLALNKKYIVYECWL